MSLLRKVGVAIVIVMLTTSFAATNAVAAAHLTVLDPDFVTTTLDEEGGYELVEEMLAEGASASADDSAEASGPIDPSSILQNAVTEEYIRSQTNANVNRTYAYLHGNSDELNLSLSTEPIQESLAESFESNIQNASIAELVSQSGADLPGPVDADTLERMERSESSYEQAKAEVRGDLRERALDEAVERAFQESSNDDLIRAVGEDPDDYSEAEKERFVQEREPEIRAALRHRIEDERGDEIDAAIDDQLETMKQEATADDPETEMERAVAGVQVAVIDGLKSDTTYDEFKDDLDGAKADLAAAVTDDVDATLEEEFPERIDLLGNASDSPPEPFQQARTTVIWFDRLTFVLPVAILGLFGLLYYLRDSLASVASDTGISMLLAGLPTVLAVELGRSQLPSLVEGAPPDQQQPLELMTGVLDRGLGTVSDIALVLSAGGVVLVGLSIATRYGVFDGLLGSDAGGASEESGTEADDDAAAGDAPEGDEAGDSDEASDGDRDDDADTDADDDSTDESDSEDDDTDSSADAEESDE